MIPRFFRENIGYKILALALAIGLRFYVNGQENPQGSRTVTMSLTVRNLPANLLLSDSNPPLVSVSMTGAADDVARLNDTNVVAWVDLGRAHAGRNAALPIRVDLPTGMRQSVAIDDIEPGDVSLAIEENKDRRMRIDAPPPALAPAGFMFTAPVVTPRDVSVSGPLRSVMSVQHVVVKIDSTAVGTIDDDYPIVALDGDGADVSDVTITPPTAHVRSAMIPVPASKTVFVSPDVVGAAFPDEIGDIRVQPQSVVVVGKPEALARLGTLSTDPVNVAGMTGDVIKQVAVRVPPGIALQDPSPVTVTVQIESRTAPVVPPPQAAVPAASAPQAEPAGH